LEQKRFPHTSKKEGRSPDRRKANEVSVEKLARSPASNSVQNERRRVYSLPQELRGRQPGSDTN
jgi:hypothetical protein